MSIFIALATAITLAAVGWFISPLWRRAPAESVSSQQLNAAICLDQLAALDRDLAQGNVSEADHQLATDELQLRLLDDVTPSDHNALPTGSERWTRTRTTAMWALVLPGMAVAMYLWLGQPNAMLPQPTSGLTDVQVQAMVASLEAKLKAQPDNPKGWAMLARSYKATNRLEEAEKAYLNTGELLHTHPDLMVDFAELLAVRAGNRMAGRPLQLIEQALALDPSHPSALMMAGAAAYQVADFDGAVRLWEQLLAVLEPGSPDADITQTNLEEARLQASKARQGQPTSSR